MEHLDIIDENDTAIGSAPRSEIYEKKLLHRIVHVFIFDTEHKHILLQQRSEHMAFCPLCWCSSAAGHVKAGESAEQAAEREVMEELGISAELTLFAKDWYESEAQPGLRKLLITFTFEKPFDIIHHMHTSEREVKEMAWFEVKHARRFLEPGMHPELEFLLKKHATNLLYSSKQPEHT